MIEAIGLSKFYKDFAAIRDVTFSVPQGQVAAFLGPNGAGKSTTMKILTGYLAPSAGQARVAGMDVTSNRIAAYRFFMTDPIRFNHSIIIIRTVGDSSENSGFTTNVLEGACAYFYTQDTN